jgi:acetyl-CoA carboxylase biotin carboxyl carrier protein
VSLTAAEIQEIMRIIEASSFDELTLETNGTKLVLRRGAATATAAALPVIADARTQEVTAAAPRPAGSGQSVTSPMLGTFYRAPKPGAPPFVEVGAQVDIDTVIGIVEVMKLMNTVRAGVRGRVTGILVSDGALVEFGETLLLVAPEPG